MDGINRPRDFAQDDDPRKDTELTLGPALLLVLGCALVLLCGTCFGAGYLVGRRSAPHNDPTTTQTADGTVPELAQSTSAKPMASGATTAPPAQPAAISETPDADTAPAGTPAAGIGTAPNVTPAASPQPVRSTQAETVPQSNPARPQPATGPMVQIAAVSRAEDADVLMGALRRRGYAVTARHIPGDNLIHVQLGPFANRNEANAVSQRLLGDGYNAVVLP